MKKLIKLLVLLLVLTSCTPSDKSDNEDKVNIDASEIKVQEAKKQAEDKARQEAEAKRKAEDKKLAEEKAKKQAEQKREAEEKARQEAETKKLAEEKAKKEAEAKRIADQKRIAEEKAKREAKAKRLAEEKRIADEKAKKEAEAKKLAEQKLLAEERAKQEAEAKKAEEKAAKAKLQPNRIYYDGSNVKFFDIGIDNYNPDRTQKYIDDGNIISTVTKFNPTDNEITYFSGHSYNYNNVARLKVSSIVTITDKNGVGYKYKIVDMKKYPAGEVDQEAPFIGGYHLMDLAGEGIKKESIVIQYCDEYDVPMIFFGVPV